MDVLTLVTGLLAGSVISWPVARAFAARDPFRYVAHSRAEASYWQDQAERAKTEAARLADRASAWDAGRQAGSEEVLRVVQALTAKRS
jgi:hypothetical protein